MVAIVKFGKSLHRIFNYNENKVKEGVATCIAAANYPKDLQDLSLNHKLNRLIHTAALRSNVELKAVHISLNFHPSEKFSQEKLQEIADSYMEKIGFGQQPYLVYEHTDAGHPHIHIVSVKVDDSGNRMRTHNIGRNESTQARLQIEKDFGLIPAEGHQSNQVYQLAPITSKAVTYGRGATKQAIQNVLSKVLEEYHFTSLPELNAVLKLFNVTADRGKEDGIVFRNKGLYFRVLDPTTGKMLGVPIKASDFHFGPTLARLEEKFTKNKSRVEMYHKKRIRNAIDLILQKPLTVSLSELTEALKKQGIAIVLRQSNPSGPIYGLTYVDHTTKLVINGSDLGKLYSANAIQKRCRSMNTDPVRQENASTYKQSKQTLPEQKSISIGTSAQNNQKDSEYSNDSGVDNSGKSTLEILMEAEYESGFIPAHLRLGRKKRKKKRVN